MADSSRSISGTVKVEQEQDVAATAAFLARRLWMEEFKTDPKASDGKYLELVRYCSMALKGHSVYQSNYEDVIKKLFPKT